MTINKNKHQKENYAIMRMKKDCTAELGLLFVAFIWGLTFVIIKNIVETIEPFTFNGIRFSLAGGIIFLGILAAKPHLLKRLNVNTVFKGGILGVWLFMGFAFLTVGLIYTSSTNAEFITGLNVVLVPFLSFFLTKIKMDRYLFAGMVTASMGLYFLTINDSIDLNKGDIFVLSGSFAFALHVILTEKYVQHCSIPLLVLIQIMTVGILSLLSAAIFEDISVVLNPEVMLKQQMIFALFIVVFFATGLALVIQTRVQRKVAASKVALIYSMEPVFAALSGYIWAGEVLGLRSVSGCILILSGMIAVDLPTHIKYFARTN